MKKGITITQRFELENVTSVDNLTDAIFTYKENENEGSKDADYLLIKKMSNEDVTFDDGKFIIPLSQADTLKLTRIYYIEAQLIYNTGATNKWNIAKKSMRPTLRTEDVNGQSDGSEVEDLRMTIDDVFANGGGTTSDYNELENKPKINDVTLSGNKTSENLGLASASDLNAKADKDTTYTKTETDNLLSGKQNTITGGNGIDVSSDVVSVDIATSNELLGFNPQGKLQVFAGNIGRDENVRQYLVNTNYNYPLASKSYVDNLISGTLKRLVVQSLPTEDIDTNTIYMILRSAPTTNNIYDEYMYINNAWELIGSTEVDLSGYQEKLTVGNGIDITNNTISVKVRNLTDNALTVSSYGLYVSKDTLAVDGGFRQSLADVRSPYALQPKLTAGTNITIDSNNVISASGGGNPITDTAKGSTISLTDSADSPLDAISIMGKSTQNGTPTIDSPIPIVDITAEEIEITNGTDTQSAELTITLRGVPIQDNDANYNYVDSNGQRWMCDTIERYKDGSGKLIQRIKQVVYSGQETWYDYEGGVVFSSHGAFNRAIASNANYRRSFNTHFYTLKSSASSVSQNDNVYFVSTTYFACSPTINGERLDKDEFKAFLANSPMTLEYVLDTPIETPLTSEELAELELSTYYPTTNISSNADVVVEYVVDVGTALSTKQDKLTAGTNITIDSNNVISASGGSYTFTDGLTESSGTVGIDLASGSKLLIDANDKLDVDLSSKQDTIDSTHKLDADLVDDSTSTNKFVTATEKSTWNGKADNTTISTDTTSTTVSLTLADNHEYRYTQDLASLTLTMPSGDFISSIVFASGSTPTSMTYDSSIKWSGNDVSSNAFVPQANMEYEIVFWYNGLSINAVVRGVA